MTVPMTRSIDLNPDAPFAVARREAPATKGATASFVVVPIARRDVHTGDLVTIGCRHEGKRLIATAVTVTDIPSK
jgi:hypothetical protein